MWYSKKEELYYNEPIVAEFHDGRKQLLLPSNNVNSYKIVGYNWFDLTDGRWGSSATWKTPQEAVQSRRSDGWDVFNVHLTYTKVQDEKIYNY